jgi:uncharacterized protein YjbJ (UPF0337 family)
MKIRMKSNEKISKWNDIKDEVQKVWGKLTEEELENTDGDLESIDSLIQQKYSEPHNGYREKLSLIFKKQLKHKRVKAYQL